MIAVLLLPVVQLALPSGRPPGLAGVPTTEQVRNMASVGRDVGRLEKYGTALFPAYEIILADPHSRPDHLMRVMDAIRHVKAPRERFLAPAVALLAHDHGWVRETALDLLVRIGTPAEGSVLVALLMDERANVARAAAWTLAETGGPREVAALNAWLRSSQFCHHGPGFREHVQWCRDLLDARLRGVHLAPAPRPKP